MHPDAQPPEEATRGQELAQASERQAPEPTSEVGDQKGTHNHRAPVGRITHEDDQWNRKVETPNAVGAVERESPPAEGDVPPSEAVPERRSTKRRRNRPLRGPGAYRSWRGSRPAQQLLSSRR
jgi:hypothetical protein